MTVTRDSLMVVGSGRGGRRPRADRPSRKRVEFRLTDEEHRELERVAAAERKPVATLIREAVNGFVGDFCDRKLFRDSE